MKNIIKSIELEDFNSIINNYREKLVDIQNFVQSILSKEFVFFQLDHTQDFFHKLKELVQLNIIKKNVKISDF